MLPPGGNRDWEITGNRVPIPDTWFPEALFSNGADTLDVYETVVEHHVYRRQTTTEIYVEGSYTDTKDVIRLLEEKNLKNFSWNSLSFSLSRYKKRVGQYWLTLWFYWWRPQGDLNPCCRRERPVSWTRLDDGDTGNTHGAAHGVTNDCVTLRSALCAMR